MCVVIDGNSVFLGLLRGGADNAGPESAIEQIMEFGRTTIPPYVPVEITAESMRKQGLEHTLVKTLDGHLVGVRYGKDAERT
jgi:hypothetical protein